MKPFAAPLDDILFTLEHVADAGSLMDWDRDTASEIGAHFATFAEAEIAPLDEEGDRDGARFRDGRIRMPAGFGAAYRAYCDQGWPGLTAPEAYGGQELGSLMLAITSEIFSGANHSLQMVTGLVPGAIRTILVFGNDAQKNRYLPALADGTLLATMCLTEAGAGSDLSRIRCRASQDAEGWVLSGEKIFISGGDQDLSDGILHLVLARTSGDGIKGLSLFLCPSRRRDGSRNTFDVTRIEEKMGLHASPTCQLSFADAEAELIGEEGKGLAAMFTMMNHARLDVALQGVAHAARSHDVASAYAAERVQGKGADGTQVTIDAHAEIRRMLDEIDALALGGRAISHLAYVLMESGTERDLVEFLTPIAKVYCSTAGMKAAELGMQVLGGYGYLHEYRLEQTYRDVRITAIYEGANGIHERALVTRLLHGPGGDAFANFIGARAPGIHKQWIAARDIMATHDDPAPFAHDFLAFSCEALLLVLFARMTAASEHHPDPNRIARVCEHAIRRGAARLAYRANLLTT